MKSFTPTSVSLQKNRHSLKPSSARWRPEVSKEFFPPRPDSRPTIYAYEDSNPQYAGMLKVGYTTRTAKQRLDEIYNITMPGKPPYRILLEESAMRSDGTAFYDHEVHR